MAAAIPTPPSSSIAPSQHASLLPEPRKHPLKAGSAKESGLIRYLDAKVNGVVKRVENRVNYRKIDRDDEQLDQGSGGARGGGEGFKAFWEVAKEIDELVDVIWVSGSPNLQIPYLLNFAVMTSEYLPYFSPAPRATFRLLSKLDTAFSSLLQGRDLDTGEYLPGFENGRTVSTTDKVRLKGIVDRTRLMVVKAMTKDSVIGDGMDEDEPEPMDTDEDTEDEGLVKFEGFENNDDDDDEEDEEWEERQIASVYERTIGELGDVLGGPPIGIITDD